MNLKVERKPPNFRINNRALTGQEPRFARNFDIKNQDSKHIAKKAELKKLEEKIK